MATFKVEEDRDWSNLPIDIIGKVKEKLVCWSDQRHLPLVCKNWSVSQRLFPFSILFPWLLTLKTIRFNGSFRDTQYELYDPLRKKTHLVGEIPKPDNEEVVLDVHIYGSKFGWLLLKNTARREYTVWTLFAPLTGELITLPLLGRSGMVTFTMSSTSPECVVSMFKESPDGRHIACWTFRLGDATWKTFKIDPPPHVTQLSCSPLVVTYFNGLFYCLYREGELCEINLELKEWRWLKQGSPRLEINCAKKWYRFVDSCTDLLLYETSNNCSMTKLDEPDTKKPRLLRYDFSDNLWIHEHNLSNRQILRDEGCYWRARELIMDKIPLDIKNSKGYENIHYAPDWLPKEYTGFVKGNRSYQDYIIWFDQRLVWRKNDLLKLSQ